MIPIRRVTALAATLLAVSLTGCVPEPARTPPAPPPDGSAAAPVSAPAARPASVPAAPDALPEAGPTPTSTPGAQRLTVTVSGDLLWHKGLLADGVEAGEASGRDYDFVPLFEHIRPLIEGRTSRSAMWRCRSPRAV